jgi:hypothetical protein
MYYYNVDAYPKIASIDILQVESNVYSHGFYYHKYVDFTPIILYGITPTIHFLCDRKRS